MPGCWVYEQGRYLWRPGYWIANQEGWSWTPAHYRWTPSGAILVEGYWDYPLTNRGLLFAPVAFDRAIWTRPNWSFTPRYVVTADSLLGSLFVRSATRHYYFGDYFGERYHRKLKILYDQVREEAQLQGLIPTEPVEAVKEERVDPSTQGEQPLPGLIMEALRNNWAVPDERKPKLVDELCNMIENPEVKTTARSPAKPATDHDGLAEGRCRYTAKA